MKKLFLTVCVLVLAAAMITPASAQSKIALNIGADVLIPVGDFGTAQSVGFGGDVTGEYAVMPELNLTATLGYFTWGGKDFTESGFTVSGASFHGVPFLVGAKYYFVPKSANMRFYGAAQIGLFFGSASVNTPAIPGVTIGGVTFGGTPAQSVSVSSTDFAYSPIVGFEAPIAANGLIDASAKWLGISSSGSFGVRVGYKFML